MQVFHQQTPLGMPLSLNTAMPNCYTSNTQKSFSITENNTCSCSASDTTIKEPEFLLGATASKNNSSRHSSATNNTVTSQSSKENDHIALLHLEHINSSNISNVEQMSSNNCVTWQNSAGFTTEQRDDDEEGGIALLNQSDCTPLLCMESNSDGSFYVLNSRELSLPDKSLS